ncbi:2-methylisoborneol synthase [Streptomyces syringium]|uniref:Terpene synthase n=2 Tax=Streptomyces syringium TaxID=76729 RepID=A0ABS4XW86_9ACTN|nr:2-methylisoborneol synthase [Streptomyces syringium]
MAARFGYGTMLCHPDTEDLDNLMIAARCIAAEYAIDDLYCDEAASGARPTLLGPRLSLAQSAIDPPYLPAEETSHWNRHRGADPVLRAMHHATEHLASKATPSQIHRFRHEIANLYLGCHAETGWRMTGRMPTLWEYITNRQLNNFRPCLTITDIIGGYELPDIVYAHPQVQKATALACNAATFTNDLYSFHKETATIETQFNLPTVIAAQQHCSIHEAFHQAARITNSYVHNFEKHATQLWPVAEPELRRYLTGLWHWMAGSRLWHATVPRYNTPTPDSS